MKNYRVLEELNDIKLIDNQKAEIDAHRPFSKELENKIFQKLKLDWNYNSNAIEGNQLSYGETVAFLNFGLTAKGKPFKDHLDIKGHNEAIGFMLQLIKEDRPLSESDIKDLHKIILVEPYLSKTISPEGIEFQKEIKIGQYKTSPNHVMTISGDTHYYTNPEEVAFEMNNLLEWYRNAESENLHPVIISAVFHHKFTSIHPFDDGNGRLARILSNFILLKHQYPVLVIKNKDKTLYYSALNIADNGIYQDLVKLFTENIGYSFEIMQRAIRGENINEADDLDKEIELFTKQMQVQNIKTVDFEKDKDFLIDSYVKNFLDYLIPKLNKMGELFQDSNIEFCDDDIDLINLNPIYNFDFEVSRKHINRIFRYQVDNKQIKLEIVFGFNNLVNLDKYFQLIVDVQVLFQTKSVQYIFGELPKINYEKEILYSDIPRPTFEELAKNIINYLIDKIKSNSKT